MQVQPDFTSGRPSRAPGVARPLTAVLAGAIAAIAIAAPHAAEGADLCVNVAGLEFYAARVRAPRPGRCAALDAYTAEGDIVTGTMCTGADATTLRIGYTRPPTSDRPEVETGTVDLALPAMSEGIATFGLQDLAASSSGVEGGFAWARECVAPLFPRTNPRP